MKRMSCKEFERLSQDLIDRELDTARTSAVRGHMRLCEPCARSFRDIEAIALVAQKLETLEPPPSLWAGIDARLADEEVADSQRSRVWFWWQQIRRPTMVGGLVAATATAAFVLATLTRRAPARVDESAPVAMIDVPSEFALSHSVSVSADAAHALSSVESDYEGAIDELSVLLEDERKHWSRAAADVFQQRMRVINETLAREKTLASAQPDNPLAHDGLYAGYRDKVALLQQAVLAHDEWQ